MFILSAFEATINVHELIWTSDEPILKYTNTKYSIPE